MEKWLPIPGMYGYEASDTGRIRSLSRKVNCGKGYRTIPTKVLSPFLVKSTGYRQVKVRGKKYSAHRLIAMTWCDGFFEGACVDHINGVRDDNRPENLQWVTSSENSFRSFKNGRITPTKGKFSKDHPTSKAVISTSLFSGEVRIWESAMDAVRAGFDSSCISRCCAGKSKHHKGHYWRFANAAEPNPYEGRAA